MKSLLSFLKSVIIIVALVLVMGFAMIQIRNCQTDEPGGDVEVENIILNETEIVF